MFRDAKVGDKIYCYPIGKMVTIEAIFKNKNFPLLLSDGNTIDYKGCVYVEDANPTYFWNKVQITPPPKPKRKVKKTIEGFIRDSAYDKREFVFRKGFLDKDDVQSKWYPATLAYEIEE